MINVLIRDFSDPEPEIDCKRPVPTNPLDDSCFDLIRLWVSQCTEHVGCSETTSVRLPKRVIEISANPSESPRLRITNGESGQYVILSHCWGSKGLAKLKDSLITEYQEAIAPEVLPRSFRDAIDITRRLGFRYLWIDALCISQDNAVDWAEEAPKMASYYGQSTLMIAATAAEDSSRGILTNRDVLYSPVLGKEQRYCLRQRLLRWVWDIKRSVLATRGWAAQERMLAPRIIHYTRRQMIWECAKGLRFEASGIDEKKIGSGQIDLDFKKEKLQPFVTKALDGANSAFDGQNDNVDRASDAKLSQISLNQIRTWQQCVDEYSKCSLTISSDKLHALSGVAAIVNHDGEMGQYLAGLWSKHVAAGLIWSRPWALLSSPSAYRAPSWSWASVDGEVSSLVLASLPELLQPSTDETGKKWAKRFDLKLIKHHMVLQDTRNAYGAVLEGSYIIVEGACITHKELLRLSKDIYEDSFNGPTTVLDKSNIYDCPCCGPPAQENGDSSQEDEESSQEQEDASAENQPQDDTHKPAHYDFCMFLISDAWRSPKGFVDMLLLSWVDQETKVAKRVGLLRMSLWQKKEDLEHFNQKFNAAERERWTLKLV